MDPETLYDAVSNVGIKDGRITAITREEISGEETIDATRHVVAPGFIDTHYHPTTTGRDPWGINLHCGTGVPA